MNQICKNISETCTYFSITGISMNKFEYVNFIKEKDNKVIWITSSDYILWLEMKIFCVKIVKN